MGFLSPLSTLHRAIGAGLTVALLAVAVWGWRIDTLRARYAAQLDRVVMVLEPAIAAKVRRDTAAGGAALVVRQRDQARRERDNARAVVKAQSDSIAALAAEGERLKRLGARDRALAEDMIRERDVWIARADQAATRTERRAAETELEECNAVLDALYRSGF